MVTVRRYSTTIISTEWLGIANKLAIFRSCERGDVAYGRGRPHRRSLHRYTDILSFLPLIATLLYCKNYSIRTHGKANFFSNVVSVHHLIK